MRKQKKVYKLNYKTIKRNILILLFLILFVKYINFMDNYNKKSLAVYQDYITQCEIEGVKANQEDFKAFQKTNDNF